MPIGPHPSSIKFKKTRCFDGNGVLRPISPFLRPWAHKSDARLKYSIEFRTVCSLRHMHDLDSYSPTLLTDAGTAIRGFDIGLGNRVIISLCHTTSKFGVLTLYATARTPKRDKNSLRRRLDSPRTRPTILLFPSICNAIRPISSPRHGHVSTNLAPFVQNHLPR